MKVSWIEPGEIAASSVPVGVTDIGSLVGQGIRGIVTLTEYPLTVQSELTLSYFAEQKLAYFHAAVVDHYPPEWALMEQIVEFLDWVRDERPAAFVHCQAGVGRTGTILHAYYLALGMPFEQVKLLIKQKRPACQYVILSPRQKAFLDKWAASKI